MCLPNNRNLLKIQCPEYDFSHANFSQIKVSRDRERRGPLASEVKW